MPALLESGIAGAEDEAPKVAKVAEFFDLDHGDTPDRDGWFLPVNVTVEA